MEDTSIGCGIMMIFLAFFLQGCSLPEILIVCGVILALYLIHESFWM